MAYTKNTWADGDIVTSEKLNHMEDGIAGAGGIMVINDTDNTLDKTWQEIYDAMSAGKMCVVKKDSGDLEGGISAEMVCSVYVDRGKYIANVSTGISHYYSASSATGYPEFKFDAGGNPPVVS